MVAKKTNIKRTVNHEAKNRVMDLLKSKMSVLAGVPADAPAYPNGTPVVEVAVQNEFGLGVPERSFVRSTFKDNKSKYKQQVSKAIKESLEGGSLKKSLGRIGAGASSDIKSKITAIKEPPNSPSTIADKGSNNPLIDTGHMRNSVTYEVINK